MEKVTSCGCNPQDRTQCRECEQGQEKREKETEDIRKPEKSRKVSEREDDAWNQDSSSPEREPIDQE